MLGLLGYLFPAELCGRVEGVKRFYEGTRPARHFKRFKGLKAGKRQA